MKVKKLVLKNFGIHRSLVFETNGRPIIGLLGKNGSGKSTILESVKYALTGELDGKLEDAVTIGKKKGFVELIIDKDGTEIRIKREVGKSPKREFERDGNKLTAVKDIDAALQGLLSVDKRALSNACFLKQGSLNDLLFGTESAREQLFIKLVNLSFCERYANIIDTKIKTLSVGVEDLQSLSDEINIQRMDSVVEKELLEKQLSRVVDYNPAITLLSESKVIQNNLDTASSEIKELENKIISDKATLGSIFVGYNVTSREDLELHISKLRQEHTDYLESKSDLIDKKNIRNKYKSTLEDITTTKKDIEETTKALGETTKSKNELELPDCHLEELNEKLTLLNNDIKQNGEWLSMQHSQCEAADNVCLKCGLTLKERIKQTDIDKIQNTLELQVLQKLELEKVIEDELEAVKAYEASKLVLTDKENELHVTLDLLKKTFSSLAEKIKEVMVGATIGEQISDELKDINDNVEKLQSSIKQADGDLSKVISADATIASNESLIVSKRAVCATKNTKLVDNERLLADELDKLDMAMFIDSSTDKLKLELESRQKERIEAEGRAKQAQEAFNKISERYRDIQTRMSENENRLKVVEELKSIKHILSKKGLPSAYIDHKFNKLVRLTSENLAILNADFVVEKDPENLLSFVFERFDGEEHVRLPMNRLSGGQKVRLCIAFLLAVQQELVPEIGFQTFDEPSTHLDEEGVERLCSMFKSLQEVLRCVDHQVWVCDHNPLLEESFNNTLMLK